MYQYVEQIVFGDSEVDEISCIIESRNENRYNTADWKFANEVNLLSYIGELDATGREIYEGDIVEMNQWFPSDDPARGGYQYTGYIKYVNAKFIIYSEDDSSGFYNNMNELFSWDELTVIGNIYENSKLL